MEQLVIVTEIGVVIALCLGLAIWYQKGRIDWAKKDIERLQKEVLDMQSAKWKSESELRDCVRSGDRDSREFFSKNISELNTEVARLREQLRGREDEKLKESARRFFDKEADERLTRIEKSLREIEKWRRESACSGCGARDGITSKFCSSVRRVENSSLIV